MNRARPKPRTWQAARKNISVGSLNDVLPNPRITLEVQDARETEKRLTERAVTISDPVKLYEDKFWVGGFLDSEGNKPGFVPTPNSQALSGRRSCDEMREFSNLVSRTLFREYRFKRGF